MDEKTISAVMEYMNDQEAVRERFRKIYRTIKKPNITRVAWELEISPMTVNAFLKGNRNVELRILWKIDCWTAAKESEIAAEIMQGLKEIRKPEMDKVQAE